MSKKILTKPATVFVPKMNITKILSDQFFNSNFECLVDIMIFLPSCDLLNFVLVNQNVFRLFTEAKKMSIENQRIALLNDDKSRGNVQIDAVNRLFETNTFVQDIGEFKMNFKQKYLKNEKSQCDTFDVISNDPNFVIFGGSVMLNMFKDWDKGVFGTAEEMEKLYGNSDIDVFLIPENESVDREMAFRTLLKKLNKVIKYNYVVCKYYDVFNIIPENPKLRKIQILLRKYSSLDDLLLFADLDCTRFAYTGKKVISTDDGIWSIQKRVNLLPNFLNVPNFTPRIEKYRVRGFNTYFYPSHPLFFKMMKTKEFKNIEFEKDSEVTVEKKEMRGMRELRMRGGPFYKRFIYRRILSKRSRGTGNWKVNTRIVNLKDNGEAEGDPVFYEDVLIDYSQAMNLLEEKRGTEVEKNHHVFQVYNMLVTVYKKIHQFLNVDYSDHFSVGLSTFLLMKKFLIRSCYCCGKFTQHYSFDQLKNKAHCLKCKKMNEDKLKLSLNMKGKHAIITGGRIKIGYSCALKLLRCGATVIVTTRFAENAKTRYLKEEDSDKWKDRLFVYPLDLKNGNHVIKFTEMIREKFPKIDILINNAAITVRRPYQYYKDLIEKELKIKKKKTGLVRSDISNLAKAKSGKKGKKQQNKDKTNPFSLREGMDFFPSLENLKKLKKENKEMKKKENEERKRKEVENKKREIEKINPFALVPVKNETTIQTYKNLVKETMNSLKSYLNKEDYDTMGNTELFPTNLKDEFDEQIDMREENSWTKKINQIDATEILEVQAVNNISPTILVSKLFKHMIPKMGGPSYIINVTSDEGYFDNSRKKNQNHPHTNISKAALNQLTRSNCEYLARFGILINSVDVGWSTSDRVVKLTVPPPLSIEDSTARILNVIFEKSKMYGKMFRNYKSVDW